MVAAIVACGDAPAYHSTRSSRLVHFTLRSRLTHRELHEILVVPPRHGRWLLVLLHGYHASPSQFLTQPFFDTMPPCARALPRSCCSTAAPTATGTTGPTDAGDR